ncbi:hypothetical protein F7725_026226 [Dissostichus mawsoni]|uniref:ER membrane protein complex subunit 8 n=1 Tax=Dissostichus mawsoni TaxID=36200 RepID=A0A7J5X6G6_DISMA|nr:hypothetical protein F7725_026226 [Dissostichus mawsoni]
MVSESIAVTTYSDCKLAGSSRSSCSHSSSLRICFVFFTGFSGFFKNMPIQLTSQAYCKMLLHAAKYPHFAVNGLLVAEKTKEKKKESHSEPVLCVDCIDTWCKENNYIIAGYYQANERTKDSRKVAARISENFHEAAIVMLDTSRLTMSCFEPIVLIYDHHEHKWKSREVTFDCFEDWNEAQKITSSLLEGRSYENLIDFDNHLDDLRNDWTNPVINKAVLDLC